VSLLGWHDVHSPPAQQLRLLRLIILVIMIVVYVCSGCRQEFSQLRHCHAHQSKAGTARVGGSYQRAGASCDAAYPMTPSTLRMTHGARSRPTIYLTCSVLCAVCLQESPLSCVSCGFVTVKHHTTVGLRPGRTTSIQVVVPVGKQDVLSTPPSHASSLGPNSLPPSVPASPPPDGKDQEGPTMSQNILRSLQAHPDADSTQSLRPEWVQPATWYPTDDTLKNVEITKVAGVDDGGVDDGQVGIHKPPS